MTRGGRGKVVFGAALVLAASSSFLLFSKLDPIEVVPLHDVTLEAALQPRNGGNPIDYKPPLSNHRGLQRRDSDHSINYPRPEIHGKTVDGPGIFVQMLRRARERVSDSDVPFLLEVPHTGSDTIYNILTTCYGLRGRRYLGTEELARDKELGVVDKYYVSSHEKPPDGDYFHFVSTPHYQEGAALFSFEHRGRIMLMMRHPCVIAESMYLSRPGTTKGDVKGLLNFTMSPDYYDNWMTRMIANVPESRAVTESDFVEARKILENKFLIGMTSDIAETVIKRMKLYFGWKELPNQKGCELEYIRQAISALPPSSLVEGSYEWREIQRINRYDMKLYARSMSVFGSQKMGMPIHELVAGEEKKAARTSVENLSDVSEAKEKSDIPFFWHIPKASGTTVKETLSDCYGLVRTEMIRPPSSLDIITKSNVLNVDLSTPEAVATAKEIGLAEKGLADVFISQLVEASTVFTPEHRGRAFTILRHPVTLAASLFYYRRIATWEPTYRPEYNDITLEEYVKMDGYYDNWMVRMLANAKLGGLNQDHLDLAKSILSERFVIGMSEHMDETFRQLELYFGWKENKAGCVQDHLHAPSNKNNRYPDLERGGTVWNTIADRNKFDMSLYYYALQIFGIQSEKLIKDSSRML
ncbi:hypothetical protein HJC23_013327 [Cyclotella cryptica]|uniref:Sulfotransferase domain-containing protein n=1 Tax=Cyclotella cryptica TaxID=29204 RepID=A0ABD3Q048_9STRA|eukprot:CCRYP_009727-RA/>CCRYP_009727-RA protein AED:0.05 eAED:0.05 QI:150/1/1/1/1/1/6/243/640